jgi:glycosyltransferase involved in cell wall biosynthesis
MASSDNDIMKILAFLNSFTQGKSGGDMCFIETYRRVKDIELTVVTSHLGKQLCEEYGLQAQFILTTNEKQFQNILITYLTRIWKGITFDFGSNYDLVYASSDALPDVLPAFLFTLKNPKVKFVCKIFHIIPTSRFVAFLSQKVSHLILKKSTDLIITDNNNLKLKLGSTGFDSSSIHLIYPSVDLHELQQIKPRMEFTATFLGRLHKSKGIEDMIDIWEQVIRKHPELTLGVIGKGQKDYEKKINTLINEKGLSKNIQLLGFINDNEAYSLIKGSSVFLFPSHEEGFGMVIAESFALGTPVIAYDLPVYKELFYPVIVTVPCYAKDQYTNQVLDLLHNPRKYATVIAEGKDIAGRYDWNKAVQKETKLLASLVE